MEAVMMKMLARIEELHQQQIEMTERLNLPLEDRYESASINEFATALSKAQGQFQSAIANSRISGAGFYNNYFTSLDNTLKAVRVPLAENGLSIVQKLLWADENSPTIYTKILHSSGQWIGSEVKLSPKTTALRDIGSSISYMKRFSLQALLNITLEEDLTDDDAEAAMKDTQTMLHKGISSKVDPKNNRFKKSFGAITAEQLQILHSELDQHEDLAEKVLDDMNLVSLSDLLQEDFGPVLKRIREIKMTERNIR